jgi:hypothetical protein
MLVSPKPISRDPERTQSEPPAPGSAVALLLVYVALVLFLTQAAIVPVSLLQTPGIENFMVGP